ncbi:hypothetical protein, partial [Klebsiella pneumoniae]|uniref:hypothetical protein n=1 Tax=Klebsiella pneumoniae TaxID=573 RepID=UPI0020061040
DLLLLLAIGLTNGQLIGDCRLLRHCAAPLGCFAGRERKIIVQFSLRTIQTTQLISTIQNNFHFNFKLSLTH